MWTQERIDLLKKWAEQGVSYGVIAERLGVTRNSVIGKANREKLPPRIGSLREAAFKKRQEKERKKAIRERARQATAEAREAAKRLCRPAKSEDSGPGIKTLIAIPTNGYLDHEGCRWPHGEVCKHKPLPLKPYCSDHWRQSHA